MPKRDDWLTKDEKGEWHVLPEKAILLRGWVRDGLTDKVIATKNMRIAYSTFREWRDAYPAFSALLKNTKEIVDYAMENALYKAGMEGNVAAMIFWLKNRKPDKWRDKPTYDADAEMFTKLDALLAGVKDATVK